MRDILLIIILITSLFALAFGIACPIMYLQKQTFNEMNNTNYTLWQWVWCDDAIKLQHATERVK